MPQKYWYLRLAVPSEAASTRLLFDPRHRAVVGLLNFLTAVTLYSSLIPISLYVSIELIKYFQVTHAYPASRHTALLAPCKPTAGDCVPEKVLWIR